MWDAGKHMFLTCKDRALNFKGLIVSGLQAREENREAPEPRSSHPREETLCCMQATLRLAFEVVDMGKQGGLLFQNYFHTNFQT